MNWILVLLGGGFGAVTRYSIQMLTGKPDGHTFPMSTFLANVIGCLMIGVLGALSYKFKWNENLSLFIMTGFLGGFTTFSSFSIEFMQLLKNNHIYLALMYLLLSNFVGLSVCAIGFYFIKN